MDKDEQIKLLQDELEHAFWSFDLFKVASLRIRINQLEGQKRLEKDPYDLAERLFDGRWREDE